MQNAPGNCQNAPNKINSTPNPLPEVPLGGPGEGGEIPRSANFPETGDLENSGISGQNSKKNFEPFVFKFKGFLATPVPKEENYADNSPVTQKKMPSPSPQETPVGGNTAFFSRSQAFLMCHKIRNFRNFPVTN